jgi:hypothetical protein
LWIAIFWWRRRRHHLAGDQKVDNFAGDVDREEKRREPCIEERRRQQGHRQERALPLPGKRKEQQPRSHADSAAAGLFRRRFGETCRTGRSVIGLSRVARSSRFLFQCRMASGSARRSGFGRCWRCPSRHGSEGLGRAAGQRLEIPALTPRSPYGRKLWSKFDQNVALSALGRAQALVLLSLTRRNPESGLRETACFAHRIRVLPRPATRYHSDM